MHFYKYIICFVCSCSLILSPLTSRAIFSEMTTREERNLGLEFDLIMKTQAPLLYDPFIQGYVQDITDKLLQYAPPQPFPFESNVIIDSTLNAFAVPGGFLFLNTGMFLSMESEDELAAIMAHEIAHVTRRHIAKRQAASQKIMLASFLAAVASAFVGSSEAGGAIAIGSLAAGQSALLSYSRSDENEADNFGFSYMTSAGYDPQAYITSFQKLQAQFSLSGSIPAYLSSHPDLDARIVNISSRLRSQNSTLNIQQTDNSRFLEVQTFVRAQLDSINNAKIVLSKMDKNMPMTQLAYGIVYARDFKINEAKKAYTTLEEIISKDNNIENYSFYLREIGRFNFEYLDINKAEILLKNATELDKDDLMAQYFLARTLSKLDKNSEAEEYYLNILEKYPYDSEIHNLLGHVYGKTEEHQKGYLHLAYSSLYKADFANAKKMRENAEKLAKTDAENNSIKAFDKNFQIYRNIISES